MVDKAHIKLEINGSSRELLVDPSQTLAQVLREDLGLTGTKVACNQGVCGTCTILADGVAVRACLSLAVAMQGRELTTIEGIAQNGQIDRVQRVFNEKGALQCGYCTPGMIISTKALLARNPNPSVDEIRHELGGNICRCTGYVKIIEAVVALRDS